VKSDAFPQVNMERTVPDKYLQMRDKFAKTMSMPAAKTKAARTFNAGRSKGTKPVLSRGKGAFAAKKGK
jgi:hypothetical protein